MECQTIPESNEYNIAECFWLECDVDLNRLEQALHKVVHNCPVMRTRFLMMGGEKLLLNRAYSTHIINAYGPTEFTVCSSNHLVDQQYDRDDIPIGRPVPNSISAIIDPSGNLLPRGMTGEFVLLGTQIASGYWHRPELTAEKFVNAPFLSG